MRSWRPTCEAVHLTALGLWLGSVVMAGAAAAVLFPEMKALAPHLPRLDAYTGDHWRLAAGRIAARVFFVADTIQFACAMLATISLAACIAFAREAMPPRTTLARAALLVLLVGVLAFHLLVFMPGFNATARAYWEAAADARNGDALRLQAALDRMHPTATTLLTIITIGLLFLLFLSAYSIAAGRRAHSAGSPSAAPTSPRLEEPLLAKARR